MPPQPIQQTAIFTEERILLSIGLWSGLLLADGILWSRWLSGALTIPLSAGLVWGSSLTVTVIAVFALINWRESKTAALPGTPWWPELLTLFSPFLWGLAIGLPASALTWGGLVALWGMLIVAVGLVHLWFPQATGEPASDTVSDRETFPPAVGSPITDHAPPIHYQKRLIVDGVEVIEGEATADFLPGQKEAILHLSFCPPFSALPDVHAEDALGGDLEIRAEAVYPFGARLSVRRASGIEAAASRQVSYLASPSETGEAAA